MLGGLSATVDPWQGRRLPSKFSIEELLAIATGGGAPYGGGTVVAAGAPASAGSGCSSSVRQTAAAGGAPHGGLTVAAGAPRDGGGWRSCARRLLEEISFWVWNMRELSEKISFWVVMHSL